MNPDHKISLELTWHIVQIISAALYEMPFRVANPVLAELHKQITEQAVNNVVPISPPEEKSS